MADQQEADNLVVHEKRLGPGYRFLVRSAVLAIACAFMFFAGMTWLKLSVSENNTKLLKLDTIIESEVRAQNEELLQEGKIFLQHNRPYDDNGNPTPEWVQYLERQRAIARARANGATASEKATLLYSKIKRVWD